MVSLRKNAKPKYGYKSSGKKRRHRKREAIGDAADGADCCCFVGEVFGGVGDCFVVTAANDDDVTAPQVTTLRAYRDQRLRSNPLGRAFTDLYYRWGPYGARVLRRNPALRPVVRVLLTPVVWYAGRRIR